VGSWCGGERLVKSVHGGFDSKNLFVTLLILDILSHKPLELVGEELFELMDICMSEANVIEEIESKVLFEVGTALEVVGMLTPTVGHISSIPSRQMLINNVAHPVDGLAPAGGIH
jgi:hypothetical protein